MAENRYGATPTEEQVKEARENRPGDPFATVKGNEVVTPTQGEYLYPHTTNRERLNGLSVAKKQVEHDERPSLKNTFKKILLILRGRSV